MRDIDHADYGPDGHSVPKDEWRRWQLRGRPLRKERHLELYAAKDEETLFLEPDLDDKLTAIAIHESSIISDRLKRKIKKLKLWGT